MLFLEAIMVKTLYHKHPGAVSVKYLTPPSINYACSNLCSQSNQRQRLLDRMIQYGVNDENAESRRQGQVSMQLPLGIHNIRPHGYHIQWRYQNSIKLKGFMDNGEVFA